MLGLRKVFFVGVFGAVFFHPVSGQTKEVFNADVVIAKAEQLSKQPYGDNRLNLPETLANLNPEQYSDISFIRAEGPWYNKSLPFEMQLYHPGGLFNHSIKINEIVDGKSHEVVYNYHDFGFGKNQINPETFSQNIGYAGFRLHYPLNTKAYYDELISFLGASYFRSMAKGQRYGLSARGLAVNTAENTPEEFPIFKEFWIERPHKNSAKIKIYALLDSPSISGAYTFEIAVSEETKVDVNVVLFPRQDISKLGIAPLTSMFLYGENTRFRFDDYRPEVHDSDGLLILNANGEKIWRPLDNSKHLRLSSFVDDGPKGFGLMQRDRNARDYLDPEAMYELRPSVWIEPLENWHKGKVQLAELPSVNETNDNVVTYWVPDEPIKAGGKYIYNYRLHWGDEAPIMPELAKVTATHSGIGGDGLAGEYNHDKRKFVIDFREFVNKNLQKEIENGNIWADISNQAGAISNINLMYTPSINGATLYFDFEPNKEIVELRVLLRDKSNSNRVVSEIWSYQWWK